MTIPISQLLADISSEAPTPGGGSVAALTGAFGAALGRMVLRLAQARGDSDLAPEVLAAHVDELDHLREELMEGYTLDAAAYHDVVLAHRLPHGDEEETAAREAAVQQALRVATLVPMVTAHRAFSVLTLCLEAVEHAQPVAVTDAGTGASLAGAAVTGALYSAEANLRGLSDQAFVGETRAEIEELRQAASARWHAVDDAVRRRLHG